MASPPSKRPSNRKMKASLKPAPIAQRAPDGRPVPGVKKGPPLQQPEFRDQRPSTTDCRNCVISRVRITTADARPLLFDPATAGDFGRIGVADNERAITLVATPNPRNCPCHWSNVEVQYVVVLTGAARRMKRSQFKLSQLVQPMVLDPRSNPYVTVTNCTCTIAISDLDRDLRAGINTQRDFYQGVPMAVLIAVKCGRRAVTLRIDLRDP